MPTRPEPIFTFGKLLMANHVHAVPGKRLLISRLMVLLLGSVVSLGLYHYSADHQRQKATFEMKLVAQDRALGVAGRAQQLLTITNSLRSLVANQPDLRKKTFEDQAAVFLKAYPEIHSIGWAPLVKEPQLAALNRNAKQQGIIFTLHNHTDEQIVQAAAGKISSQFDGYFLPIFYQTGTAVTVRTPGFDLMSLGLFRDEIRQAMREKRAVISRTFGRLTEQDRQSLGRIFAPVEVKGKVLGMITLLLDMRRFMEQIATRQSGRPVPFEIYDETDHNKLPVFHWPAKAAFSAGDTELPQVDRQVPFFDHTWKLVHVATDNYAKSFETRLPLILLAGGFAFTLAIYLIMRHAQIKAEQALAHSNAQYWELEQTNRRLNNKIIERGTFESAHQELQQRLTDFQMLVDGYFWELDTDCKLTYLSRQAIKWTGKPVTKAINTHFTKHLHEDDAIELRHLMEQALAENRTFTMEVRALGEKNRWRWEKVFGKPLFDENELPIGFRGYSHDITAFKQLRLQMEQAIAGDELFYGETSSSCR